MIENTENTDNFNPKKPSEVKPEIIASNEEIIEDENQITGIDPLAALRLDMFEEEQRPEPNSKPDLLQRMTGTLSSRKVPTRPHSVADSEQNFGMRTTRHLPPPEPSMRTAQAQNEDIHEEFLEERLSSEPLIAPKNKPKQVEQSDGAIHIEGDPKAEGGLFTHSSDVSDNQSVSYTEKRGRRRMDPIWDNAEDEVEENQESISEKPEELFNRPVEEHKVLGSGVERQYQVNKYLSYNPKRSWSERYQELSKVEKILLYVLVAAVIMVIGLIGFLYLSSRQIFFPQERPSVSTTQALVPTAAQKIPIPSGLKLTGGWSFQLSQGVLKDGKWLPTSSEWLIGTEIRRVIALPWNKQLDAVVKSLEPNNPIELYMNNGDILTFKVQSVSQVPLSDSSVMYDTRPSIAIILINPDTAFRLVVIAYP